jgi:hypothetical protein
MNQDIIEQQDQDNWKPKVLAIGAVLGAAVGVAATYLLIQHYGEDEPPKIDLAEGIKIGVLVAGLLRSIATL